jgi:outer membrane protein OmpA-like peptidoglycan-associated protein
MVAVRVRDTSKWTYDTSESRGASVAIVAAETGKLILKTPAGQRFAFDFAAVGAGASFGFKLPGIGKLQNGGVSVSANYSSQANTSGGIVYTLDSFHGKELEPRDFTGFCLLIEIGAGFVAGVNGAAMICHLTPRDLIEGIPQEFLIDTAVGQFGADVLNKAGITDKLGIQNATAVILMYGLNQGLQAFAGGTAYLGYVSIGPPPDELNLLDLDIPSSIDEPPIQVRLISQDSGWVQVTGDVLFRFGKYDLRPRAMTVLTQAAMLLRSQGARRIMVNGYTDSVGTASFNMMLSRYRAKTVAEWLKRFMAPTTAQIDWQGWGATDPVAPNTLPSHADNPAGRRRNRRVEIQFFKN